MVATDDGGGGGSLGLGSGPLGTFLSTEKSSTRWAAGAGVWRTADAVELSISGRRTSSSAAAAATLLFAAMVVVFVSLLPTLSDPLAETV
ncbi:hypothetical protein U9M48_041628 [Paspalum notatum var. saurae]|uniref:Uncharacterized protein n=1 Tax=Paspalum notatum var. saurae TaxID=547442 RepID=A0AAQ3UPG3_PASNO